jgi:hypothetical protein
LKDYDIPVSSLALILMLRATVANGRRAHTCSVRYTNRIAPNL